MPDLLQTFLKYDLGYLRIVAELWGLELESQDLNSAAEELAASLLDLEAVTETIDILSADSRNALNSLVELNGRMEWAAFARKYGEIREMGAGKRDREKPHLNPISPAEHLFYRAFLAKAFFETSKGSQEFAYIPDDLLEVLHETGTQREIAREPLGRPATPLEKAFEIPATDHVLDDATSYLAALRMKKPDFSTDANLQALLSTAGIIKKNILQAEAVKQLLEVSRADALEMLYRSWISSQTFDELRLIPEIICEGEWTNQPRVTREFLMNLLKAIPNGKWWSLSTFLKTIKEKYPDFQRPAGDYDSWFIKRISDGQYLRGFAYWDSVDGALIRKIIQTLHWLGKMDLASAEQNGAFTAFRFSSVVKQDEKGKIVVSSNGRITVSKYFSRAVRYQIARFCEWDHEKQDDFVYSVSAQSLKKAVEQGLKAEQLLAILVKHTNGSVPPALVKALKQWDANGTQARVETLLVLRVSKPEIMEEMRLSKAGKFLGELLSPTAVIVKEGAIQKVMEAAAELGLFVEVTGSTRE